MRTLIVATAYSTSKMPHELLPGEIAFYRSEADNGNMTIDQYPSKLFPRGQIAIGKVSGQPLVIPIYKHHESYVHGEYVGATTFQAKVTVVAQNMVGDYTLIIAKKGVPFNERNKWTSTTYVCDSDTTAKDIAAAIAKDVNNNSISSGVTATVQDEVITLTAKEKGVGYSLITADWLSKVTPVVITEGNAAYGDAAYVKDLMMKACADAGIEYTYQDGADLIYPTYPPQPLATIPATDYGFDIFTIKFSEPRDSRTVDMAINQVVQIAVPRTEDGENDICTNIDNILEEFCNYNYD